MLCVGSFLECACLQVKAAELEESGEGEGSDSDQAPAVAEGDQQGESEEGAGGEIDSNGSGDDEVHCDEMSDGESTSDEHVKGAGDSDDSDHDDEGESACGELQHSPAESDASTLVLPGRGDDDEAGAPVPGLSQGPGDGCDSDCSEKSAVVHTPECSQPPMEDRFNTPHGDHPKHFTDAELTEMCISLLQYIGQTHPDIAKYLCYIFISACKVMILSFIFCFSTFLLFLSVLHPIFDTRASLRQDAVVAYMQHAEWAFQRFGLAASGWLATREHWNAWFALHKAGGRKKARLLIVV